LTSAVPNFILFFLGNWGFLNIVGKAFSNFDRGVPLSRKKYHLELLIMRQKIPYEMSALVSRTGRHSLWELSSQ
jgi:hypothetical protein